MNRLLGRDRGRRRDSRDRIEDADDDELGRPDREGTETEDRKRDAPISLHKQSVRPG